MRSVCTVEKEEALRLLNGRKGGLSTPQAQERLVKYGKNQLKEGKQVGFFALFFSQFKDFMTLLLIAAAAVSAVIATLSGESKDLTDTFIILFIILLNAVVGTVQQFRADKAIRALGKLSQTQAKVWRDGKLTECNGEDLVVGDVIELEEGDVIPADCRILTQNNLACDESALTGESESVDKTERRMPQGKTFYGKGCALFKSTFVVRGNARAVVAKTGMSTEIGKIASLIGEQKPTQTPLEKSLEKLGKGITIFVLAVTAVIFMMGFLVRGDGLLKNFMTAVAVAVAAIPEGLPAVVTIIMAMGVQRMSKKKVVIRKLQSVETLGGCNVICTDKTGTLTQNRMRVTEVWSAADSCDRLLKCMRAAVNVKGEKGALVGDPTEKALVVYAEEKGMPSTFVRTAENPFSSERKRMSVYGKEGGKCVLYAKGAPDVLIQRCNYLLTEGGVVALNQEKRNQILEKVESYSSAALRVLAFAYREDGKEEENLIFCGLCGLCDGLRDGVKEAVATCQGAGVTTVMITGDHATTAFAIGKQLGICHDRQEVVTGEQLDALPPKLRAEKIAQSRVFARVTPKHKNMVVKVLQGRGKVVAMTGDGINDAPSVRSADIGIAMGKTGTDVTKNASDMVICDDNFATIVSAVREGRRIFANIKKTVTFFLATNLAEVFSLLVASLFFFSHTFLSSTQLLWLNLITDSFPVLALGVEGEDGNSMSRPPMRAEKALFSRSTAWEVLSFGIFQTAVTMGVFGWGLSAWNNGVATTMAFLTLSFLELFHAFNVRSGDRSAFSKGAFSNKVLTFTVALGVAVNLLLLALPFLRGAFGLTVLNGVQWLVVTLSSLSVLAFGEVYKLLRRLATKNGSHGV